MKNYESFKVLGSLLKECRGVQRALREAWRFLFGIHVYPPALGERLDGPSAPVQARGGLWVRRPQRMA